MRGAPRFVSGPAAGRGDVVAFVPEVSTRIAWSWPWARVAGVEVMPLAAIELHDSGVTRHEIRDPDRLALRRLVFVGAGVWLICAAVRLAAKAGRGE